MLGLVVLGLLCFEQLSHDSRFYLKLVTLDNMCNSTHQIVIALWV